MTRGLDGSSIGSVSGTGTGELETETFSTVEAKFWVCKLIS